jgi:uncharacterized iron-regulated protein
LQFEKKGRIKKMVPLEPDQPAKLRTPSPTNAVEAIIQAFDNYSVVALGECIHGEQKYYDFVISLIQHPPFQSKVNYIAVEIGNALYQIIVDKYVSGQEVSPDQLRQVWRNHTCSYQTLDSALYEPFYSAVRDVNHFLPESRHLRVLLGDPPIDWAKMNKLTDWQPFVMQRDQHFARIIEDEVLSKGSKVLLIAGTGHILRPEQEHVVSLIEKSHPGTTFVIATYGGPDRTSEMDELFSSWPVASIGLVKDTWLGEADGGLHGQDWATFLKDGTVVEGSPYKGTKIKEMLDAYLYLGPPDSMRCPDGLDISQEQEYMSELKRRQAILADDPLLASRWGERCESHQKTEKQS